MQNGTYHAVQDGSYTPRVILVRVRRPRRPAAAPIASGGGATRRRHAPSFHALTLTLHSPASALSLQVTGGAGFIGSHVVARLVEQYKYKARVQYRMW
jgi:hypothetical protein